MDDFWTYWMCDVSTGQPLLQVRPKTGSCTLEFDGASGSHSFYLGDRVFGRAVWLDVLTAWSRKIVVSRLGVVVYEGVISTKPKWDRKAAMLTINHVDIGTFLRARYPFGLTSYYSDGTFTKPGTFACTNLSQRGAMVALIDAGTKGPLNNYGLPIEVQYRGETGTTSLEIENWRFTTVADAIDDLRNRSGGPDALFEGRWNDAGYAVTRFRAGSDTVPTLTGPNFPIILDGKGSTLVVNNYTPDALQQFTGPFAVGEGTEEDMRVGGIPLGSELPPLIPAREHTVPFKHVSDRALLNNYSMATAAAEYRPSDTWEIELQADDPVAPIEKLRRGAVLEVFVEGDLVIPDGWHQLRILTLNFGVGKTVKPTVEKIGML